MVYFRETKRSFPRPNREKRYPMRCVTIDGEPYVLHEGESIVMPKGHPHAVYAQEQFKMLLVVVF